MSGKRSSKVHVASTSLDSRTIVELRALANRIGGADSARKQELLRLAAHRAPPNADALVSYHDVLLFLLAYPENPRMRSIAARELARAADVARDIAVAGPERSRTKLRDSGIAWSTITIAFSHAIARWLV